MTIPPATLITEHGAFAVPPCPPWCELALTHDLDEHLDPGALVEAYPGVSRVHEAGRVGFRTLDGAAALVVTQVEELCQNDAPGERVHIVLHDIEDLSSAQARELAGVLVAAAEQLEAIEGSS